jgi:hypothetical protein
MTNNPWINHIKKIQQQYNLSYKDAMREASVKHGGKIGGASSIYGGIFEAGKNQKIANQYEAAEKNQIRRWGIYKIHDGLYNQLLEKREKARLKKNQKSRQKYRLKKEKSKSVKKPNVDDK